MGGKVKVMEGNNVILNETYYRVAKTNYGYEFQLEKPDVPDVDYTPIPSARVTMMTKPGQTLVYSVVGESDIDIFWWDCPATVVPTVKRITVIDEGTQRPIYMTEAHTGTVYLGPRGPHAITKAGRLYLIRIEELGQKEMGRMGIVFNYYD